ncbi:MAG: UvrD-helicase domain-containing protein [Clostridia bacterium]|nr:UvrD-helicase domain-containing protein [Clostridia bacterium]
MAIWTEAQLSAIETANKTILVSAAAGSGKTTTLTERIIRKITDKESSADIGRFLIVTFTKAAASDLRSKISKALGKALAKDPGNRRLSMQMIKLGGADICTMDSFYYSVVKQNFEVLGLPSRLTMPDEGELKVLRRRIMEETVDAFYESKREGFREFMDCFMDSRGRSDAADSLLKIYDTLDGYPEFLEYLPQNADELEAEAKTPFLLTRAGVEIKERTLKFFRYAEKVYSDAVTAIMGDDKAAKVYGPAFLYDKNHFEMTRSAVKESNYEKASELFALYGKISLGPLRSADPLFAKFKELRKECYTEYEKLGDNYFSSSEKQLSYDAIKTAEFCRILYEILSDFYKRFSKEKLQSGKCDFADNKRFTLKLFIGDDGMPTPLAREYSEKYDEIYIDEYQDTDLVQDMIFSAISKPNNRFMVGDIKQSIYRFRGANPDVFADYKSTFPPVKMAGKSHSCAIYMSENFRCDKPIIDFTNSVCGFLFRKSPNSIGYTENDDLICGKVHEGERKLKKPIVSLIRTYNARTLAKMTDEEREKLSGSGSELEANYIVSEIKRLLSDPNEKCGDIGAERQIEPRDIAVLTRNNNAADHIAKALSDMGIPSSARTTVNYFENPEVLLALSLLSVIDNPGRDIHLAAVLRSPLFGIGLGELIEIRKKGEGGISLYDDVIFAEKNSENEILRSKLQYFLSKLELYRRRARLMSVDKLLRFLYSDTAMLSFVGSENNCGEEIKTEEKRANLLLLYDYARRYESGAYKGLSSFIGYINDIIESGQTIEPPASSGTQNVVSVMTIHNSKGLEFPICFIASTQRAIKRNRKKIIEFDHKTGIGFLFGEESGFASLNNPIHRSIADKNSYDELEEELRVMYVALTRARERLYISGYVSGDGFEDEASVRAEYADEYSVMSCGSCLSLVMTALMSAEAGSESVADINILQPYDIIKPSRSEEILKAYPVEGETGEDEGRLYDMFKSRFDFEYEYSHLTSIPAKLSVSKLYPEILDNADAAELSTNEISLMEKPSFLLPKKERATSAEKGTATHTFLQFCDFDKTEELGIDAELKRLCAMGLMEEGMASLVNTAELEKFFYGDFYRALKRTVDDGGRIYRERRFNILLDASDFTADAEFGEKIKGEKILVQGVIDLVIVDENGDITLCDYKTDRLSINELSSAALAAAKLGDRHRTQLSYYSRAVEQIFGKSPSRVCIYSLPFGDALDIRI